MERPVRKWIDRIGETTIDRAISDEDWEDGDRNAG